MTVVCCDCIQYLSRSGCTIETGMPRFEMAPLPCDLCSSPSLVYDCPSLDLHTDISAPLAGMTVRVVTYDRYSTLYATTELTHTRGIAKSRAQILQDHRISFLRHRVARTANVPVPEFPGIQETSEQEIPPQVQVVQEFTQPLAEAASPMSAFLGRGRSERPYRRLFETECNRR